MHGFPYLLLSVIYSTAISAIAKHIKNKSFRKRTFQEFYAPITVTYITASQIKVIVAISAPPDRKCSCKRLMFSARNHTL